MMQTEGRQWPQNRQPRRGCSSKLCMKLQQPVQQTTSVGYRKIGALQCVDLKRKIKMHYELNVSILLEYFLIV